MRTVANLLTRVLTVGVAGAATGQVDTTVRPSQKVLSPATEPNWHPTAEQQELIQKVTQAYFAARDNGRSEEAYGRLSPRQKQILPFGTYRQKLEDFNAKSGVVQARTLRAVTWYKDQPQGGPGLYVAVDYSSQFSNLALHCGYLVWQEQPDGTFLLIREEANVIDKEMMAKLKPEEIQKVRREYRC